MSNAKSSDLTYWAKQWLKEAMNDVTGMRRNDYRIIAFRDMDGREGFSPHLYEVTRARQEAAKRVGSGRLALVTERVVEGETVAYCEAYDFSTDESVTVVQPYRKGFLSRKRLGEERVLGPAEPFPEPEYENMNLREFVEFVAQTRGPERDSRFTRLDGVVYLAKNRRGLPQGLASEEFDGRSGILEEAARYAREGAPFVAACFYDKEVLRVWCWDSSSGERVGMEAALQHAARGVSPSVRLGPADPPPPLQSLS